MQPLGGALQIHGVDGDDDDVLMRVAMVTQRAAVTCTGQYATTATRRQASVDVVLESPATSVIGVQTALLSGRKDVTNIPVRNYRTCRPQRGSWGTFRTHCYRACERSWSG